MYERTLIYIHNILWDKNTLPAVGIEGFVESHLCQLCVILRSRVLLGVCPH